MNERSFNKVFDMRGLTWFILLSFGLAWTIWELAIRSGVSVLSLQFQPYALAGGFAPAIAAVIVRQWVTGEGFGDAGLRPNPQRWRFYVFGWLLPLAVGACIILEAMVMGIGQPDLTLERAILAKPAIRELGMQNAGLAIVPQLLLTALLATPLLWGEEFGWRGYLQPRLFRGKPMAAAIATGVIWALWHFPLTLRGYNYPDFPVLGSMLFMVFTVMISYIFGWIYARSGSIWASSLAHSATNSVGNLSLLWLVGAAGPTVISYAGVLAVPPLALVCAILFWLDRRRNEAALRADSMQ
jgi:membrane protease YdiL (CAAX protease family)